jgi:hypothetical protein
VEAEFRLDNNAYGLELDSLWLGGFEKVSPPVICQHLADIKRAIT